MSATDLELAYHMGYDDALAKRKPDASKVHMLGRGECHDEGDPSDFCCSECGVRMFNNTSDTYTMIASDGRTIIEHPNYCPNCGRKVVEPTTNDVGAEVTDG